jgi:hypothetical protein
MHDAYLNAHLGKLDIKLGIKYTDSSTCASSMAALKQLRGGGGGHPTVTIVLGPHCLLSTARMVDMAHVRR